MHFFVLASNLDVNFFIFIIREYISAEYSLQDIKWFW